MYMIYLLGGVYNDSRIYVTCAHMPEIETRPEKRLMK
jgi:hypothetical protein